MFNTMHVINFVQECLRLANGRRTGTFTHRVYMVPPCTSGTSYNTVKVLTHPALPPTIAVGMVRIATGIICTSTTIMRVHHVTGTPTRGRRMP
jgi:hypothetical protein